MPPSRFDPNQVGLCLSTLFPNPGAIDAAEVDALLAICRDAGFTTLCLSPPLISAVGQDTLKAAVERMGMDVRTIEAIIGWSDGPDSAAEDTQGCLDLAAFFGADTLLAATISPEFDYQRALRGLERACELAAEQNVSVALEFIPGTAVPDLATAWRMVKESGAPNGGVVLDTLHWYHQPGGPDFELLHSIPKDKIIYVQICDSPPITTPEGMEYITFAMTGRMLPGEGVVDIPAVLQLLEEKGVEPFFAMEVFNTELALTGPEAMTGQLRKALDRLFS